MKIFLNASRRHIEQLGSADKVLLKIEELAAGEPIQISDKLAGLVNFPDANPVQLGEKIEADLAISLGGDGTFLRTAQWVADSGVPILGINAGHLGYLADMTPDEFIAQGVDSLKVEPRMVLQLECSEPLPKGFWPYALNEVALLKTDTASMIQVHACVEGNELTTYRADGLLVSTPTGSTAYNMSVGGPIIAPGTPALVISPVAPHALTMRPLVLSSESVITLEPTSRAKVCLLSLDSRTAPVPSGCKITIRRADFSVKVAQRADHHFAATLRTKLLWGS